MMWSTTGQYWFWHDRNGQVFRYESAQMPAALANHQPRDSADPAAAAQQYQSAMSWEASPATQQQAYSRHAALQAAEVRWARLEHVLGLGAIAAGILVGLWALTRVIAWFAGLS